MLDLRSADLHERNLMGADLSDADLSDANLSMIRLSRANFFRADLSRANLTGANLNWVTLHFAILSGAQLSGAQFSGAQLGGAQLRNVDLSGLEFSGANLSYLDLSGLDLSGANLWTANLINANLNGATLTDACLWETQRAGWSIRCIRCEAVYWDSARRERTLYSPGEFERLYADKTKIVLHYKGGMSPIEIATLPVLIQQIEATPPRCVLRLQSVQDAPGGATVTLVVEDIGEGDPTHIAEQLQESAKQFRLRSAMLWSKPTYARALNASGPNSKMRCFPY